MRIILLKFDDLEIESPEELLRFLNDDRRVSNSKIAKLVNEKRHIISSWLEQEGAKDWAERLKSEFSKREPSGQMDDVIQIIKLTSPNPQIRFHETKCFGQSYALARYKTSSSWIYIDRNGSIVDKGYEDAHHFSREGFAAVMKDGLWGFIDRDFNCRTGFKYNRVGDFSEGLAYFELNNPETGIVNRGFLDTSFKIAIDLTDNYKGFGLQFDSIFREGLFKIWSDCHAEWIDHSGIIVAKIHSIEDLGFSYHDFFHVGSIVNGLATISVDDRKIRRRRAFPYLVREQRIIGGCDSMTCCSDYCQEGFAVACEEVTLDYHNIPHFSALGYVNRNKQCESGYRYERAQKFSEGRAAVFDGEKWSYIGTDFFPVKLDKFEGAEHFSEGYAAVRLYNKWGFVNRDIEVVIDTKFEDVRHYSEGMAAVKSGGKWGFINTKGEFVIPALFDDVKYFSEGFCEVCRDNKWEFINKEGELLRIHLG